MAFVVLVVALTGAVLSSQSTQITGHHEAIEKSGTKTIDQEKEITLWEAWFPDSIALYTFFLVIFTGVLAFGGVIQLKLLTRAEGISARSAQAAKESSDATKAAVELSDKTSERQLRAYIGVNGMDVKVYPLEGGEFAFIAHIEMKNFGQTPANEMSVWSEALIAGPDAKPFDMTKEPERPAGGSIAFPTAGFNVDKGWAVSAADKEALFKREKFVFLWGSVRYTDVFGKDRYFRYRMQSTGQIVIGTEGTYAIAPLDYESN